MDLQQRCRSMITQQRCANPIMRCIMRPWDRRCNPESSPRATEVWIDDTQRQCRQTPCFLAPCHAPHHTPCHAPHHAPHVPQQTSTNRRNNLSLGNLSIRCHRLSRACTKPSRIAFTSFMRSSRSGVWSKSVFQFWLALPTQLSMHICTAAVRPHAHLKKASLFCFQVSVKWAMNLVHLKSTLALPTTFWSTNAQTHASPRYITSHDRGFVFSRAPCLLAVACQATR